jgi:hypothetical protein
MKNILTGNEAIEAYELLQGSYSLKNMPKVCGYFTSDDCESTSNYDKGTIVAFDSTDGDKYELYFSNSTDAIDWINK